MLYHESPPQLSHVHNVFHVSLLRGYKYHPLHVDSNPLEQSYEKQDDPFCQNSLEEL
ncbi:hypothetical protein Tco_0544687, partial [Tanacetum coccineum]